MPTRTEAIRKFFEDIGEGLRAQDSKEWRQEFLWNESCDYVLKYYKDVLTSLFFKFARKSPIPPTIK